MSSFKDGLRRSGQSVLVSILDIKYDGATQSQIDAQKQANLAVITSKTKSLEKTSK